MGLSSDECIAFEDSKIGFDSENSAGLRTVVTLSEYTKKKTLKGLFVVFDYLGDENQSFEIINRYSDPSFICQFRLPKGAL